MTDNIYKWELPRVGQKDQTKITAKLEELTAQAKKQGYQAGYEEGYRAGQDAGKKNIEVAQQALQKLLTVFDKPTHLIEQTVEQELLHLSVKLAEHLIKYEITKNPAVILETIKEAVAVLPFNTTQRQLLLNPADVELLQQQLAENDVILQTCQLIADDTIQRGECKLLTDSTHIDATLHTRLEAILERLLCQE
ncbi:MAG: hypothetical protein Tsb005_09100 [Gammaproteobacteria bacterium]